MYDSSWVLYANQRGVAEQTSKKNFHKDYDRWVAISKKGPSCWFWPAQHPLDRNKSASCSLQNSFAHLWARPIDQWPLVTVFADWGSSRSGFAIWKNHFRSYEVKNVAWEVRKGSWYSFRTHHWAAWSSGGTALPSHLRRDCMDPTVSYS